MLLFSCSDHTIRIWKYYKTQNTGSYIRLLIGHSREVTGLYWIPRSFRVFSTSLDGTVRLWDVDRGICIKMKRTEGYGYIAAVSSPNRLFFACLTASQTVEIFSQTTLELLFTLLVLYLSIIDPR